MLTRAGLKKGAVKRALLEAMVICEDLAKGAQPLCGRGLCHQLAALLNRQGSVQSSTYKYVEGQLCLAFQTWPKFTGWISYPVPGDSDDPSDVYHSSNDAAMWDINTQYGRDRRELCAHVAAEFRKLLTK